MRCPRLLQSLRLGGTGPASSSNGLEHVLVYECMYTVVSMRHPSPHSFLLASTQPTVTMLSAVSTVHSREFSVSAFVPSFESLDTSPDILFCTSKIGARSPSVVAMAACMSSQSRQHHFFSLFTASEASIIGGETQRDDGNCSMTALPSLPSKHPSINNSRKMPLAMLHKLQDRMMMGGTNFVLW